MGEGEPAAVGAQASQKTVYVLQVRGTANMEVVYEILNWKKELNMELNMKKFVTQLIGYLYFFGLMSFLNYYSPN